MFTYRVRPRILKFDPGTKITVPEVAEVIFHFAPRQAFGSEAGGGRTAVQAVAATMTFDVQSGQYTVESEQPLVPLKLLVDDAAVRLTVSGNKVTVTKIVTSKDDLLSLVETIYYVLPLLLAPDFADPPIIEKVEGTVGASRFGWNLQKWKAQLWTTTQEKQAEYVRNAWHRLPRMTNNRRLVAALYYYHVAARLERVSACPGEFLAESLLNYCKVLEVLFSASTPVVREQLRALGFSDDEVERDFIPVMVLRSKIDVAHVSLALFTDSQLTTLHRYADRTEKSFKTLLSRLLARFDDGTLVLPDYQLHGADAEATEIIRRMEQALAALGNRP
jgi:hypothetical protein